MKLPPGSRCPRRGARVGDRPGRVHHRAVHRPSASDDRTDPQRLHHPPGGPYDLRKLRGKELVIKPGRTRRYHVPSAAARTITALLTVRDKVITPLITAVRIPRRGRPPKNRTQIDRDYETIRLDMKTLFNHLGNAVKPASE